MITNSGGRSHCLAFISTHLCLLIGFTPFWPGRNTEATLFSSKRATLWDTLFHLLRTYQKVAALQQIWKTFLVWNQSFLVITKIFLMCPHPHFHQSMSTESSYDGATTMIHPLLHYSWTPPRYNFISGRSYTLKHNTMITDCYCHGCPVYTRLDSLRLWSCPGRETSGRCRDTQKQLPLQLQATGGKVLTVVCAYEPNISSYYLAFMESLDGVLQGIPLFCWVSSMPLHVGNDGVIGKGLEPWTVFAY